MPIYEYSCDNCRKIFEEWTRHIDDNTVQTCPECGGTARRIVSNTSFVLKGGGWYVTEYGNRKSASDKDASGTGEGGAKPAAPAENQTSGNTSDSTAAAKPEAAPKAESVKPQASGSAAQAS